MNRGVFDELSLGMDKLGVNPVCSRSSFFSSLSIRLWSLLELFLTAKLLDSGLGFKFMFALALVILSFVMGLVGSKFPIPSFCD